jgi:hypothetical protein
LRKEQALTDEIKSNLDKVLKDFAAKFVPGGKN